MNGGGCHGTGLAYPGLSRECPCLVGYDGIAIWHGDCPRCHEGRIPLQGAELVVALTVILNRQSEWAYSGHWWDQLVEGPDRTAALARAVGLMHLAMLGVKE